MHITLFHSWYITPPPFTSHIHINGSFTSSKKKKGNPLPPENEIKLNLKYQLLTLKNTGLKQVVQYNSFILEDVKLQS